MIEKETRSEGQWDKMKMEEKFEEKKKRNNNWILKKVNKKPKGKIQTQKHKNKLRKPAKNVFTEQQIQRHRNEWTTWAFHYVSSDVNI